MYFLRPAGKPCSISDTVPLGREPGEGGDCSWVSGQLVTGNPVGELCSCVSVRGKMKEAVSSQAI